MNTDSLNASKIHITDRFSGNDLDELINGLEGKYSNVYVLADDNTWHYCYPVIEEGAAILGRAAKLIVPAGEVSKSLEQAQDLWLRLLTSGADRNSLLINLGGGMITDLGAFVASTFKRGIPYLHIPTSLLGQIDAAIGGKTAVNLGSYKNQIGTFAVPEMIVIVQDLLKTLPERYLLSGYAEVIKHALIADRGFFNWLKKKPFHSIKQVSKNHETWKGLIAESISVKAGISERDPYDWAERRLLNFGHTIGHAFESFSLQNDKNPITHGEAVAAGMVVETILSREVLGLSSGEAQEINSQLLQNFPMFRIDDVIEQTIIDSLRFDKKVSAEDLNFTLISEIGKGEYNRQCSMKVVSKALKEYREMIKQ